MSTQTVDRLIMELGLDSTKFRQDAKYATRANEDLEKAIVGAEGASKDAEKSLKDMGDQTKKAGDKTESMGKIVVGATKILVAFFTTIATSSALVKLANGVAKANDELNFLSQRLGSSARSIKTFGNAAAMLGGSAEGMESTMKGLNQSIQEMVMFGDSSMLPYFNALGVGVTNANGEMREMSDIMLDMSDSFSNMNKQQAYALASSMGLDEGTTNALLQGRAAMQEMIDMQATLYVSTEEELKASRELAKSQAFLSAQWDGMKTMIGNMLIPVITVLVKHVSSFVEFLQRNERMTRNFFEGLAIVIGVVLTPILIKAAAAFLAFIAPIAGSAAIVGLLGAAFIALYDDYKVWSEGGKSLFDWQWFQKQFIGTADKASGLSQAFLNLIGDYKSWGEVGTDFFDWLKLKGFIDGNEVSAKSLGTGFKNLAKDIKDYLLPAFGWLSEALDKIMSGDFSGAWKMVKDLDAKSAAWMDKKGRDFMAGWNGQATFDQMWKERQAVSGGGGGGSSSGSKGGGAKLTPTKESFIRENKKGFERAAKELNIPIDGLIAQMALETGWGKSVIGGTNNLGNIKKGGNWKGATKRAYDKAEGSNDEYRVYNTKDEFWDDYIRLLKSRKAYAGALNTGKDVNAFATGLKRGGYATDPNYVGKITSMAQSVSGGLSASTPSTPAIPSPHLSRVPQPATVQGKGRSIEVNVSGITVNTTATTLGGATSEAVGATIGRSGYLNQLMSGMS